MESIDKLKKMLRTPVIADVPLEYRPQVDGIDYSTPLGETPDFGLGDPVGAMRPESAMATSAPADQLSGIGPALAKVIGARRALAGNVAPVATEPDKLNTSQALIPLGIGILARLAGAHGDAVNRAVANAWQGFHNQSVERAKRKDALNAQTFQADQQRLANEADIAGLEYKAQQGDLEAQRELQSKLAVIDAEGKQKADLQRQKDDAAVQKFNRELAALPEKASAKYKGIYQAALSMGQTPEQAAAFAMSEQYKDIASGKLDEERTKDIQLTRDARISKIKASTGVDDARAKLLEKEYENFDDVQAVKLALLKTQIESLGLTIQGKRLDNSPLKGSYELLTQEHSRIEKELGTYQSQVKETEAILRDPEKSFSLDGGKVTGPERAALQKKHDDAATKVAELTGQLDSIGSRLKDLSEKMNKATVDPWAPADPVSGRTPMKGGIPEITPANALDPKRKVKAAIDVLDEL